MEFCKYLVDPLSWFLSRDERDVYLTLKEVDENAAYRYLEKIAEDPPHTKTTIGPAMIDGFSGEMFLGSDAHPWQWYCVDITTPTQQELALIRDPNTILFSYYDINAI